MRKKIIYLILGALLVLFTGCNGGTTGGSEEKKEEVAKEDTQNKEEKKETLRDDLIIATQAEPVGFNPLKTNDRVSANINQQIYETLFVRSLDGKSYEPQLVESYENVDDTTWHFKLKEGVKFQDGTPFNAEAVKYTLEKIKDPKYGSARASIAESISEINVLGENEVEIKTKYPDGVLIAKLAHAASAMVSPNGDDLMKNPVGTGPYKLKEYVSGSHIELVANEDYWGGVPEIKKVRVDIVPEASTIISRLETGEVDFYYGATAEQLGRIKSLSNVTLKVEPSGRVNYIGIRANSSKSGTTEDFVARKAIAMAVDVDGFASTQNGLAIPTHSIIGPKILGYTDKSESYGYKYDLEGAKKLVEENNLADKEIDIVSTNTGIYNDVAEFLQGCLLQAGFKNVNIEVLEYGAFVERLRKPKTMDLAPLGWSNLTGDGFELLYPNWHSDNIGSSNRSYYQNPEFEKYVELSRATLDKAERVKALDEANKIILKDVGVIPLSHGFNVYAYGNDIKEAPMDPGGNYFIKTFTRR